jgi:hypothetical protein
MVKAHVFPECSFSPEKSSTDFDGIKSSMGFKFGDATFHQMEQVLASLNNSAMTVYSAHKVGVDLFECCTRRLCLKGSNAYLSESVSGADDIC